MRIRVCFVLFSVVAVVTAARGQKLSYADNPNNYNCDDEIVEYNPDPVRAREIKSSYVYYNTPSQQDHMPTKYIMKYNTGKKYYAPMKKESRFYQVFQSAGEKSYDQISGTPNSNSKSPAIQIYVV